MRLHRAALVLAVPFVVIACGKSDEPVSDRTMQLADESAPSVVSQLATVTSQLTPGQSGLLAIGTHCGVGVLGRLLNGYVWRTSESDGNDWVPREWYSEPSPPDPIEVVVALSDDGTVLTAQLNGREVAYEQDGREFADSDECA